MSLATQLDVLCDARVALVAKCNEIGASVSEGATFRDCEKALCKLAGIDPSTPGLTQIAELGLLQTDLVRAANALDCSLPSSATIPEVAEALHALTVEEKAYAVALSDPTSSGKYVLRFLRAAATPVVGEAYQGISIAKVYADFEDEAYTSNSKVPWYPDHDNFTEVHFDAVVEPAACSYYFYMFRNCTLFDLRLLSTRRSVQFKYMFYYCNSVTSLDLSSFDIRRGAEFAYMFYFCTALTSLDVRGWNLESATSIVCMFRNCTKLPVLDLSTWKFGSKLTTAYQCFYNCSSLVTIFAPPGCDLSSISNTGMMFSYCNSLRGGNGTVHSSANVTGVYARTDAADAPGYFTASRDLSGGAFAVLTDVGELVFARGDAPVVGGIYKGAKVMGAYIGFDSANYSMPGQLPWYAERTSVLEVHFDGWVKPASLGYLFGNLTNCESFDLRGLYCAGVRNLSYLFISCNSMREVDISPLADASPSNIGFMFNFCSSLTTIYAPAGTDWSGLSSTNNVFHQCLKLVGGAGTKWESSYAKGTRAVIDGLGGKAGYFTAK